MGWGVMWTTRQGPPIEIECPRCIASPAIANTEETVERLLLLGLIPVSLMAWAFFGYSIYSLGLPLIAFFAILQMFSWSIGLAMSGMIMRVGQSAESFAWAAVFIVLTFVLPAEELAAWGWRIPFLLALPLLLVSLYLRWSISETPVFEGLVAEGRRDRTPVLSMLRQRPGALAIAIGAGLLRIGSYSLMNTYTINYGTSELGFSYQDLLVATTVGGLLQLVTIPLFGVWATRVGSSRVVAAGALGTLLITFPLYYLLQFSTFPILVATMIVGGILPTMSWAALGGLMNDLFPDRFRYSALSFAYALAATISGFVP